MKKIEQFQITSLMLSGFKSYEEPTELVFGNPTVITGGNGRGKSSIADAIAFAVTGCPFFGERGIDRLHNENNPDVAIRMCFVDETGTLHELNRTRRKNRMTITYDGYEIRQLDLADLFGERDVFLSILNPLYFIEELGEDGKKLLERYLPTIPHETVLSQLSEPVREHLKNETILSPEGSLKRCREEIRSLEERITYLRGQKDLAASQGESHEQAEQEVTLQADLLRREIAELEQRQFSSMDVSAMQERLVELSGRYEEAARDERADTSKLREQLQLLREKIARREVEKYQSKFTEALAEASARVKDLGVRYQRESAAYKAFHAGMECPACHRSVTEQSLSEVQAALKKVLSELYAAGSEQRAQLIELQEMDKKAADTFAQFKEDDLGKWAAEAAEMEQRCASLAEQASAETECLRAEIQTLTADLEYGNLSQAEYDRLGTCREELRQSEAKIAALQDMTAAQLPDFDREIAQANASIAEIKRKMANVIAYISKRAELTFSQLKMNRVEISLYDVVKSTGEVKDTFKFQYGGRRYADAARMIHYTLISAFTPRRSAFSFKIGRTTSSRNSSTCFGARPTYFFGSIVFFNSSRLKLKDGSAAISSKRLLSFPSPLTFFPASMESSRMRSWSSCLSPPAFTASIMIFSVAINGSSAIKCFSITFGYTTRPSTTFK